jgi:hypothetical protein
MYLMDYTMLAVMSAGIAGILLFVLFVLKLAEYHSEP